MNLRFIASLMIAGAACSAFAQGYTDGIEYYKADRLANAKELLLRNLDASATDKAASYYYLGMIALRDKNDAAARSYFDKGIAANPDYAYNYVGVGSMLLKSSPKEAESNFKQAEKLGKKDAGVEIAIARAYYNADPVAYAKDIEKKIEKARKINMESPDIYILEGDMRADEKKWGESAGLYEMATTYAPNATEAYVKGADIYMNVPVTGPKAAVALLKKRLANSESALARRELANIYYETNQFKEAAEEYGKYINNPNHFVSDEDRYAFLLFYGENYKAGYNYASKLLKENPDNFTAMRFQFMNAAQMPEMASSLLPMAEKLYAKHKADKNNEFAPIDFILVSSEFTVDKNFDKAEEVLNEAIATYPDNAQFNKNLAMLYVDMERYADAAKAFKTYLSKLDSPSFDDLIHQATLSYYGAIQARKDNPELAGSLFNETIEYAKKAETANPAMYRPNKIYGDVAKERASKETITSAAAADYQAAIDKLEKLPDTSKYSRDARELYNYMGNYYLDKKDTATAKKYFQKYLEYDPDNADYRKFVDSLK